MNENLNKKIEIYAAVDLGSNSFHMIVAEISNHQMHVIDRHKDMVRLANGLDDKGYLSADKMAQAISSLEKIGQRISHIPKANLRIVGTNTLRKAKNSEVFLQAAEIALGKPIDIISGREEARILYLGVSHSLPSNQGQRLVIDIGGGSTELIIGKDFNPILRESLHMGCVNYTRKYFADGSITQSNWQTAVLDARRQLLPIVSKYTTKGWQVTIGASGTMRATAQVILENKFSTYGIDSDGLDRLIATCLEIGCVNGLNNIIGLSSRRAPVFIGGLAIVKALFESLLISKIQVCSGALREGIVYDLSGRLHHNDIRKRTIQKLSHQFEIDRKQAQRVHNSMQQLIAASNINLSASQLQLLNWAAQLHELGLTISHSHFEKHAAYILINAEMPGFSKQEQLQLAALVALQRQKIKKDWLQKLSPKQTEKLLPLIVILRLGVLLNRSRVDITLEFKDVSVGNKTVRALFATGWLQNHPLTQADLQAESKYIKALGITLQIRPLICR